MSLNVSQYSALEAHSSRALATVLRPQPPTRLFALLDAAANDQLIDRLYSDPTVEFDLMLPGVPPPDEFYTAPFIADLTGCDALTEWLLSGWGQAWGVYLIANANLDTMQRHLRQYVEALLPDGRPALFRLYDPRVFRVSIPALFQAELEAFFAPLERVVCESADGRVLVHAVRAGALVISESME